MYLTKRTFIGAEYDHKKVLAKIEISADGETIPINPRRVSSIEESVGYWRKQNHIHNWFVENCQNGVDDCGEYDVDKSAIIKLLDLCKQVKESPDKAPELLPCRSGFFFGGTEYDEGYFYGIDKTITFLETIISESNPEKEYFSFDIIYSSSW